MQEDGLAAQVYAHVKARVLLGQARPGDVIAAHALAQELEVSRTPVHEALKRLVGERYLVTQARVGYTVTPINLDEMRDLFQVRTRLETLSAELAAKAWTEEHHRAFVSADKAAQQRRREAVKSVSPELSAQLVLHDEHRRFHRMIAEVGGNRRLVRLINDLQDETQRFWSLIPGDGSIGKVFLADPGHRAIFNGIASGDVRAARAAVVKHLQEGVASMVANVIPDDPPEDEPP